MRLFEVVGDEEHEELALLLVSMGELIILQQGSALAEVLCGL